MLTRAGVELCRGGANRSLPPLRAWPGLLTSPPCAPQVYFYTYTAFKKVWANLVAESPKAKMDPITNLVIASLAGVINVFATTPLWVAGTRLSVQGKKTQGKYLGVWDCLTRIASEEGVAALWKGVGPSLVLVSNPSIQFVVYERLRGFMEDLAKKRGSAITALEFFVIGAIAKCAATLATYPLQLAQSRLRADKGKEGNSKERNYKSTADVLGKVYRAEGLQGLFKGMEAKLWQTVLTAAWQLACYEKVTAIVHAAFGFDDRKVIKAAH